MVQTKPLIRPDMVIFYSWYAIRIIIFIQSDKIVLLSLWLLITAQFYKYREIITALNISASQKLDGSAISDALNSPSLSSSRPPQTYKIIP